MRETISNLVLRKFQWKDRISRTWVLLITFLLDWKQTCFNLVWRREISGAQKHRILLDKTSLKPVCSWHLIKVNLRAIPESKRLLHLVRTSLTFQKMRWDLFNPFCEEIFFGESKDYCISKSTSLTPPPHRTRLVQSHFFRGNSRAQKICISRTLLSLQRWDFSPIFFRGNSKYCIRDGCWV